jgi:hypothetical protein
MTNTMHAAMAATLLAALATGGAALAHDGNGAGRGMGPGRGLDFAAVDTDASGSISRAEHEARAPARLVEIDTTGDGSLEPAEILAATPDPRGGMAGTLRANPAEARADRMLAMMGATETGSVEVTVLTARQVDGLLARLDTDRDGAISRDEATALEKGRGGREHMRRHGQDRGHGPDDESSRF